MKPASLAAPVFVSLVAAIAGAAVQSSASEPALAQAPATPGASADPEKLKSERLAQLVAWMSGSFASTEQSKKDGSYFDIRLHVAPIWADRADAKWLYVEQALATRLEQPHRQRVYRVTAADPSTFKSEVFELPDGGAAFIGAWADAEAKFKALKPESLVARDGCAVTLKFDEKAIGGSVYAGTTHEKDCKSTQRGAAYATSEAKISPTQMISWDRGYDEAGKQVWGSEKGGYVFLKQPIEPKPVPAAKADDAKPPAKKPAAPTKPVDPKPATPSDPEPPAPTAPKP
ncbi:MAG: chromophore lyase CpcT/CpeT [Phycisphaerales bacterium]